MIMNLHSHSICAILYFEKKREEKRLFVLVSNAKIYHRKKKLQCFFSFAAPPVTLAKGRCMYRSKANG